MKIILLHFFSFTSFLVFSQVPAQQTTDTSKIYDIVEQDAEFPGGDDSLRSYIIDNIRMDSIIEFSDKEMYNRVIVRFVVNKEALRLVKSMPKWSPGIVNSQPVAMYFRLPIIFAIQ